MSQPAAGRKRLLGYTDKLTVRPGERIEFKISSLGDTPYDAQLVRLINGDVHSVAAAFKEVEIDSSVNGIHRGRQQSVALGSCVVIEDARALLDLSEWTLSVLVMPTLPGARAQYLIDSWDATAGVGWSLHLNQQGQVTFATVAPCGASSSVSIAQPLEPRTWYAVAVRVSWRDKIAKVDCAAVHTGAHGMPAFKGDAQIEVVGERPQRPCPLLMAAAFGGRDAAGRIRPIHCFNGRLEAPAIYRGLLSDLQVVQLASGERPTQLRERLVADWDFSEGIGGISITDRSTNALHGYTHNLPLHAVKGCRWDGSTFEWKHAPEHYAAIHFHDDDLYDCGWVTDLTYQIPEDLRSGIYALRVRVQGHFASTLEEEYLPFFVAAPRRAPQAAIAFIVPTYTYLAYGNLRLEEIRKRAGLSVDDFYGDVFTGPGTREYALQVQVHSEVSLSLYERHGDGSPVHFSSWLRPLLNMRPKSILWTFCADLLLIDWLEAKGFSHDIITDDLLQAEGAELLKDYSVVITGSHPEYPTTAQLDAIESYVSQGGRFMYLGGNGYYWRCAVHTELEGVIEVRRGRSGTGTWKSEVGESSLAFTGETGGLWMELGRPPQRQFGVGFIAQGSGASYYRIVPQARESRAGFILEGIEGDILGNFGIFGAAAGQEIDRTDECHGTPPHTIVVARSERHGAGMLYVIEEMDGGRPVPGDYHDRVCSEITYFETGGGGAVFSVGSMAWCGSLSHNNYDNPVSTMTANVLARFVWDGEQKRYQPQETCAVDVESRALRTAKHAHSVSAELP